MHYRIVSIIKLNLKIDVVGLILDGAYPTDWNGDTLHGVSRNALYDILLTLIADYPLTFHKGSHEFAGSGEIYDSVLNSSTNSVLWYSLRCPATRDDWKVRFSFFNDRASIVGSGLLYLGSIIVGDNYHDFDKFNGVNFDLTVGASVLSRYDTLSAEFSANKGDLLIMKWVKDSNEGANNLYLWLPELYH